MFQNSIAMNNTFRNQNYSNNNNGRINIPPARFSTPHTTDQEESRGGYDPLWRSTQETIIPGPLGLMSLSLQSPSRLEVLVLNNRPQTSSAQEGSRSTQDEQTNALKKLRKEIYNPVPKRISSRLCLYYRDQTANIPNEKEEEGKRCAVCLEDFEPKEMVMLTPCNHMFHEDCIVPWVKSHAQCPVCRSSIGDPTGRSAANNNNFTNIAPNSDLYTGGDLIAILRAMGLGAM